MVDGVLVLAGLAVLVGGGELLVRGASGIALHFRVSPAVVGLTIVAAGTSMPELVVSALAALKGSPGLSVGNVVGSNIFNIGATLGVAGLIRGFRIQGNTVRLEWPVMMLATFQLHLLARDGRVDQLEGGFLAGAMFVFMAYATWVGRNAVGSVEQAGYEQTATASMGREGKAALWFNLGAVVLGAGMLAGGSTALVQGAVGLARGLGVSDAVIGLTVVAAGTGAPELVTSLMAARRGQDDIAVANVVGSCIFNVLGIVGITALIHPLPVPETIIERDNWWMIGASLILFPLMKSGMRINRRESSVLLIGFITYMTLLVRAA